MELLGAFLTELAEFEGSRIDKAVLVLSAHKRLLGEPSMTAGEIAKAFEQAGFAKPNTTVLSNLLRSDRRVSFRAGTARALKAADEFYDEHVGELEIHDNQSAALPDEVRVSLSKTPFVDTSYVDDLEKMLELYAQLHVLENSIRRLIEKVLLGKFGTDWWDKAASSPQKRKHADRLDKEKKRKWLPARSSLGPLYSLDWTDLISLMRKFEADFIPEIGEVDFLHRYQDLGLIRHVVAHHGFIDDETEYQRVKIALSDWQKQISS